MDNVIMFPQWKKELEEEGLDALRDQDFKKALKAFEKLKSFGIESHEVTFGHLLSLVELGYFNKAQSICEDLMQTPYNVTYEYVYLYMIILFQTNQYDVLIDFMNDDLVEYDFPPHVEEQVETLYKLSLQMKENRDQETAKDYINQLKRAVEEDDHRKQWLLIEALRRMKVSPDDELLIYLKDETIHPVVKTSIIKGLSDLNISRRVLVNKFNQFVKVSPTHLKPIYTYMNEMLKDLEDVEQKDPTLFKMLKQLLYRYIYVVYPLIPNKKQAQYLMTALKILGEEQLYGVSTIDPTKEVKRYIEEISLYEQLYVMIIED